MNGDCSCAAGGKCDCGLCEVPERDRVSPAETHSRSGLRFVTAYLIICCLALFCWGAWAFWAAWRAGPQ